MGIGGGGGLGKATRFPMVAMVPNPQKTRWERRRVPLAGRIAKGEGTTGRNRGRGQD